MTKRKQKTKKAILYEGLHWSDISLSSNEVQGPSHTCYLIFPGLGIGLLAEQHGYGRNDEERRKTSYTTKILTQPQKTLTLGIHEFRLDSIVDEEFQQGGLGIYKKSRSLVRRVETEVPEHIPELLVSDEVKAFHKLHGSLPIFGNEFCDLVSRDWTQRFQDLERILEVCRRRGLFVKHETFGNYIKRVRGLENLSYPTVLPKLDITINQEWLNGLLSRRFGERHKNIFQDLCSKKNLKPLTEGYFQTGDLVVNTLHQGISLSKDNVKSESLAIILGTENNFYLHEVFPKPEPKYEWNGEKEELVDNFEGTVTAILLDPNPEDFSLHRYKIDVSMRNYPDMSTHYIGRVYTLK